MTQGNASLILEIKLHVVGGEEELSWPSCLCGPLRQLNSVFQLPFPSPRSILHKAAKHVDCFAHKSDYISPVRKTQTPYMAREAHILGSLPTSPDVFPPRLPLTPSAPVTLASFSSFELATLFSPSRHLCSRCISSLERIPARSSQVWPLLMVQVSTQTSPLRSCCPSQF